MYARVVRFTDVDPDLLAGRLTGSSPRDRPWTSRPRASSPPRRGPAHAVVIQLFETADDMAAAEGALDQMDPGDTPGTRASIDRCEIKAEVSPR